MDNNSISLGKLIGIQIAGGIIAGFIAVIGVAVIWGSMQTRLERAVTDIEKLATLMYTQREAQLELRPIIRQLERQTLQLEDIGRRVINLESMYLTQPWDGVREDKP